MSLSSDVPVGGEVFNCYLASPEGSALEEREADLCRYLFACQCERCKLERVARGDSSSDDDY